MKRGWIIAVCLAVIVACNSMKQRGDNEVSTTDMPTIAAPDSTPQPGLQIEGHVTRQDGSGLAGVRIYRRFASYPGVLVATTDESGYYNCEFQPIPGDEMVGVWAVLEGYSLQPKDNSVTWEQGIYYWRHYYGYEERVLDFIVEE